MNMSDIFKEEYSSTKTTAIYITIVLACILCFLPVMFDIKLSGTIYHEAGSQSSLYYLLNQISILIVSIPILIDLLCDVNRNRKIPGIDSLLFERFVISAGFILPAVVRISKGFNGNNLEQLENTMNHCLIMCEACIILPTIYAITMKKSPQRYTFMMYIMLLTVSVLCLGAATWAKLRRKPSLVLNITLMFLCGLFSAILSYQYRSMVLDCIYMPSNISTQEANTRYSVLMYGTFAVLYILGVITLAGSYFEARARTIGYINLAVLTWKMTLFSGLSIIAGRMARRQLNLMEQLLHEKKSFIQYISHEVRSPLSIISVGCSLMEQVLKDKGLLEDGEYLTETMESIKAATYATAETMDEVLQYEKLSLNAMNLEIVVTLAQTAFIASFQAIAPMMSPLLANKGINFEGPTSEEQSILAGHWVNVDQTKFNIAYRNLIVNAYKFTPQGGSIKSTVSIIDEETAIAQSYKKAPEFKSLQVKQSQSRGVVSLPVDTGWYMLIQVVDSGIGIAPENIPKLFNEIVQFDANRNQGGGGSGIGMYLTKSIIQLHGGYVCVQSEGIEKGSTFSILLPICKRGGTSCVLSESEIAVSPSLPSSIKSSVTSGIFKSVNDSQSSSLDSPGHENSEYSTKNIQSIRHPQTHRKGHDLRKVQPVDHKLYDNNEHQALWRLQGKFVLLVDDVPGCNKMVNRIFNRMGATCDTAVNGQMAVDEVKKRLDRIDDDTRIQQNSYVGLVGEEDLEAKEPSKMYDLILMDSCMPVMSGSQACLEIRRLGFKGLIIGLSGDLFQDEINTFKNSGADSVVAKPLDVSTFESKVNEVLDGKQ